MRARVPTPRESKAAGFKDAKHLPRPYKLRRFYTPNEVAKHNTTDDCWVSKFNKVYDLTLLLDANAGKQECDPIVLAAGTDITHWFDSITEAVCIKFISTINFNSFSLKPILNLKLEQSKCFVQQEDTCMLHQQPLTQIGIHQIFISPGGKMMRNIVLAV